MVALVSEHKKNSGINEEITEAYLEFCQTSNMERFEKELIKYLVGF